MNEHFPQKAIESLNININNKFTSRTLILKPLMLHCQNKKVKAQNGFGSYYSNIN